MIYLFLSRSIAWPLNLFGFTANNQSQEGSILDAPQPRKGDLDQSPPLISNRDLESQIERSKNMDGTKSLINAHYLAQAPTPKVLSALGKHYLTREDLESLIQARFAEETPRDRVRRFLWKE